MPRKVRHQDLLVKDFKLLYNVNQYLIKRWSVFAITISTFMLQLRTIVIYRKILGCFVITTFNWIKAMPQMPDSLMELWDSRFVTSKTLISLCWFILPAKIFQRRVKVSSIVFICRVFFMSQFQHSLSFSSPGGFEEKEEKI